LGEVRELGKSGEEGNLKRIKAAEKKRGSMKSRGNLN